MVRGLKLYHNMENVKGHSGKISTTLLKIKIFVSIQIEVAKNS